MQEQQDLEVELVQVAKTNDNSAVKVRVTQGESEQAEKIQALKIKLTQKSKTQPEQNVRRTQNKVANSKVSFNLEKLPQVRPKVIESSERLKKQEVYKFKNKRIRSKTLSSQKKIRSISSSKNQAIFRDIIKHPMKYKIIQQILPCRPEVIFQMKPAQIDFIKEQNMKMKGLQYLRSAQPQARSLPKFKLSKAKKDRSKQAFEKKRFKQLLKQRSKQKLQKIQASRKQKLQSLLQKQQKKGDIVFQRVKNHLIRSESSFYAHLVSSQSVDKALISFLKTKIQRAEITCKL